MSLPSWIVAGSVMMAAAPALALTATPTGTPAPTPSGLFRIIGHVAGQDCEGDRAGVTVHLDGHARSIVTAADGQFVFEDLTYGFYFLRFEPECPLIPCYPPQSVFVDGFGDVTVEECYEGCPAQLLLSPGAGLPGTVVDLSGRCDAARSGQVVELWFDDQPLGDTTADAAGVYEATITVPFGARQNAEHAIRAVVGSAEIANQIFGVTIGGLPCIGDCDRSGAVTVDEVIRGTRIGLGVAAVSTCMAMDSTGNGMVTVDELVAAVDRALRGCAAPDLMPTTARYTRCEERPCSAIELPTHFMEVCVANIGDADAGAFSIAQQTYRPATARIEGIPAGGQACVELPFSPTVSIFADTQNEVDERDELNNRLEAPLPFPTSCDFRIPTPCTPTATPTQLPTPTPT